MTRRRLERMLSARVAESETSPRLRSSRGAGLAEYALIFALLVTVSVGGINYIAKRSKKEATNQIECVSSRPVPDECKIKAVTKPTLPGDPAPPPTTVPPSDFVPSDDDDPPPPPPPPPPNPSTASVPANVPNPQGGADLPNPYGAVNPTDPSKWGFSVTVNLVRPDLLNPPATVPADGSLVIFEYYGDGASGETQTLTGSCVSDAAGTCTFTDFNYGYSDVDLLHVRIKQIVTNPGVAALPTPNAWDIPRP